MKIKNLKVYNTFKNIIKNIKQKLITRIMPFSLATVVSISASGCVSDEQETIHALEVQIEELMDEKNDLQNENTVLQNKNAELQNENQTLINDKQSLLDEIEYLTTPDELINNNISREDAKTLFYENDALVIDSFGDPFRFVGQYNCEILEEWRKDGFYEYYLYDKLQMEEYYRVIVKDGVKYLVNANDYSDVKLSGFTKLLQPFYYKYYDPEFGGNDKNSGYIGYMLPVCDENNLITLVDMDTFEIILSSCTFDNKHDRNSGYLDQYTSIPTYFLHYTYHVAPYNPSFGGTDIDNKGTGRCVRIKKNGKAYFVDANDFTKILAAGYKQVKWEVDEAGVGIFKIIYFNGHEEIYTADALKPTTSDVLVKKLSAKR